MIVVEARIRGREQEVCRGPGPELGGRELGGRELGGRELGGREFGVGSWALVSRDAVKQRVLDHPTVPCASGRLSMDMAVPHLKPGTVSADSYYKLTFVYHKLTVMYDKLTVSHLTRLCPAQGGCTDCRSGALSVQDTAHVSWPVTPQDDEMLCCHAPAIHHEQRASVCRRPLPIGV